ncbi:trypsin-1-like [Thrips palmi]|uniref:Phenoloxidase-activating factor 2 n=1 Tax=Thrips palmi TaxID=161013 RepID=A0A6P8YKT4_THRPL|nr:trypsin-1-like [Thrips palmi]
MGGDLASSCLRLLAASFFASFLASSGTCSGAADAADAAEPRDVLIDNGGSVVVENQSFFHVHDLDSFANSPPGDRDGGFFLPWLNANYWNRPTSTSTSTTTSTTTVSPTSHHRKNKRPNTLTKPWKPYIGWQPFNEKPANRTTNPDSILGYDIPCGIRNVEESDRIVGGSDALRGEFPWQISLQRKKVWNLQHVCGGAILAPYWVVTAGHCVDGVQPSDLSVVAGDHDLYKVEGSEQRRAVVRIVGLGYDRNTFANDITLLQLDKRLQFDSQHVAPICVPKPGHHYRTGNAVVAGWGRLSENGGLPERLQQVSLPLIPWETCKRRYKSKGFSKFLHTCQICSGRDQGGQDSCQGDSGGPLACRESDGRYYLCGVVSWGIGCARAEFPGVYTEVSCYARWINQILYNERHVLDPEKNNYYQPYQQYQQYQQHYQRGDGPEPEAEVPVQEE